MLIVLGLVAAAFVVQYTSGQTYLAVAALATLALALWRFFVPVVYELSADGVDQWVFGRLVRLPWRVITRCEIRESGVLLTFRRDESPLAAIRGLFLPFDGNRDAVVAQVRYYFQNQAVGSSSSRYKQPQGF